MSFSTLKFGFLSFGHQGFLFLPKRDGTTSSVRSLNLFKTSPLENIAHLATNTGRLLKAGSVFTFQTGSSQTVMLASYVKMATYFFKWDSGWFEILIIREWMIDSHQLHPRSEQVRGAKLARWPAHMHKQIRQKWGGFRESRYGQRKLPCLQMFGKITKIPIPVTAPSQRNGDSITLNQRTSKIECKLINENTSSRFTVGAGAAFRGVLERLSWVWSSRLGSGDAERSRFLLA